MSTTKDGKKKLPWTNILIVILVLMVLVPLVTTSMYSVRPGEEAFIYRFGKLHNRKSAGTYIKLPFGIDRISRIDLEPNKIEVPLVKEGFGNLPYTSKDGFPVFIRMNINYAVNDTAVYTRAGGNQLMITYARAQKFLIEIAASMTAEELVSGDTSLSSLLLDRLQQSSLPKDTGIKILGTELLQLDIPVADKVLAGRENYIDDWTVEVLSANIKEAYKRAYSENRLSENAMNRIKEEGFPWE